jgi:hypothetical protein
MPVLADAPGVVLQAGSGVLDERFRRTSLRGASVLACRPEARCAFFVVSVWAKGTHVKGGGQARAGEW